MLRFRLNHRFVWWGFALAVFVSAFSVFLIQPIVGKLVTPQFGGVASVWCVCLLFFQTTLLGGYTLAFLLSRLSSKTQTVSALTLFPISAMITSVPPPGAAWTMSNPETPIHDLLKVLLTNLFFQCVLLSTVSVLFQHWHRLYRPPSKGNVNTTSFAGSPYHLYSISTTGSLLALIAYPILVEPLLPTGGAVVMWNWLYRFLVFLVCMMSLQVMSGDSFYRSLSVTTRPENQRPPSWRDYGWWLALSMGGATLLVSLTNSLTSDIAPIPLLWILLLAVYLATFTVAFSGWKLYKPRVLLLAGQLLIIAHLSTSVAFMQSVPLVSIGQYLMLLLVLCMICHGELASRKPTSKYLPHFYVFLAAGGVVGAALVNLVAPLVLDTFAERVVIVVAFAGLTVFLVARQLEGRQGYRRALNYMFLIGLICLLSFDVYQLAHSAEQIIHRDRNFYGTVRVELSEAKDAVALFDGPTLHGFQVLSPEQRLVPTSYYSVDSAVGIADTFIRRRHAGQPLKYGVMGLGTGTIAAYGQEGDSIVFYELDSKIKQIAEQYFTFLRESKAHVDIALGDARQTLEKRPSEGFDMLVVDAFSGDSVPYHLLTREAVELFLRHVKRDGIILFHVSSKYMNLTPVIGNVAISIGLSSVWLDTVPTESNLALHSNYVVVSREQGFSEALGLSQFRDAYPNVRWLQLASDLHRRIWTDDHVNLLSVLN